MKEFFQYDYAGGAFELFGTAHLLTVLSLAILGGGLIALMRAAPAKSQSLARRGLVVVLLINELAWHAWNLVHGAWTPQYMLPLHLCSVMIWLTIVVMWRGYRPLYPLIYFLGIAGAIQALVTPDAGIYGFPHFRFFQTIIAHGGLVIAGCWVAIVERCRVTLADAVRVLIGLNVYAVAVWVINSAIGSNYLYVNGKPTIPTVMDAMPEWPWYIGVLEILAVALVAILWVANARREDEASRA